MAVPSLHAGAARLEFLGALRTESPVLLSASSIDSAGSALSALARSPLKLRSYGRSLAAVQAHRHSRVPGAAGSAGAEGPESMGLPWQPNPRVGMGSTKMSPGGLRFAGRPHQPSPGPLSPPTASHSPSPSPPRSPSRIGSSSSAAAAMVAMPLSEGALAEEPSPGTPLQWMEGALAHASRERKQKSAASALVDDPLKAFDVESLLSGEKPIEAAMQAYNTLLRLRVPFPAPSGGVHASRSRARGSSRSNRRGRGDAASDYWQFRSSAQTAARAGQVLHGGGRAVEELQPVEVQEDLGEEQALSFRRRRLDLCLSLLEGLHSQGNLDMGQVYHKRFFEECKVGRAVPQAFRFVALIVATSPKPPSAEGKVEAEELECSPMETSAKSGVPAEAEVLEDAAAAAAAAVSANLMRPFTLLISTCAHCADAQGALRAFRMAKESGVVPDTALFTALISALCQASQLDLAFKFFYQMESCGVKPNRHTMCALIDGCGREGQVAKAFGIYGMMQAKKMRPDRAVYNALITACIRCGALERAFDILEDMRNEKPPVAADCITAGALLGAPSLSPAQRERALLIYREQLEGALQAASQASSSPAGVTQEHTRWGWSTAQPSGHPHRGAPVDVASTAERRSASAAEPGLPSKLSHDVQEHPGAPGKGSPLRMLTAAVHACSATGDWEQALSIKEDLLRLMPVVCPDEIFLSALIDVARHAGRAGEAEAVVEEMEVQLGVPFGPGATSSLMGLYAQLGLKTKALALFQRMKQKVRLTVPTFNALISLLCAQGALEEALEVAAEMKAAGGGPDKGTYTLLLEACLRSEASASREGDEGLAGVGSAKGSAAILALRLYQMARNDDVRIGLRLCELMIDLCAEMVAKNAPAPPAAFLHSFIAASSLVGQHASAKDVLRADHIPSVPGGLEQQSVRGSGAAAGRNARGSAGGMQPFAHPSAQAGGTQQQLASSLDHQKQQRQQHQQQQPSVQRAALQYQSLVGSTVFPITGWRLVALRVYDHSICGGVVPTLNVLSKLMGLLRRTAGPARTQHSTLPLAQEQPGPGSSQPEAALEGESLQAPAQHSSTSSSSQGAFSAGMDLGLRLDAGLGRLYHPLAFAIYEEAERLGAVPEVSNASGPLTLRLEACPPNLAEVCILTVLRTLEQRLRAAPGLKLFPVSIHLAVSSLDLVLLGPVPPRVEQQAVKAPQRGRKGLRNAGKGKTTVTPQAELSPGNHSRVRHVSVVSRTGQAVAALLRRMELPVMGYETRGTLRITASALTSWLRSTMSSMDTYSLPGRGGAHPLFHTQTLQALVSNHSFCEGSPYEGSSAPQHQGLSGQAPTRSSRGSCETVQQLLHGNKLSLQAQQIRLHEVDKDVHV